MPQGKQASASQRLNPTSIACACPQQERPLRGEACVPQGEDHTQQWKAAPACCSEKALVWQQRPSTDNNNTLQKKSSVSLIWYLLGFLCS